ncbi:MAG TPA: P27 family phage terminase small subunit [Vicinamibacterales bacterium]|nr:P27 family phage terminase small subunit [Vicinamibacterales bacterium]
MAGGWNRKPLELHRQAGTYRADRHGAVDAPAPAAVDDAPIAKPRWLSGGAGVVWAELAPIAQSLGTLQPSDVTAFGGLCELEATRQAVSAQKDAQGFDLASDEGRRTLRAERATAAALRPFLALFALEPVARARMVAPRPANKAPSRWAGVLP